MHVLVNPDLQLRKQSVAISPERILTPEFQQFIKEMKETMAMENGVGLAAPQIGVLERVILVETQDGPQAFINPVIIHRSLRKIDSEEGCLSVPGVFGIVRRHRRVTVQAFNERAEAVTIHAQQFPAIIFQHETDHLDGVLFIDRAKKTWEADHKPTYPMV